MNDAWEQAAARGDASSLSAQLSRGADVDARDRFGQTSLMLAARRGHLDGVRVLVEAGADLDVTAKFGLSATMLAVVNHHASVATLLAEAGANLELLGSGAPGFELKSAEQLAREEGLEALAESLKP